MPTLEDEQKLDTTKDIFGRDRHGTDKEDMSGTGSFSRHNTTLWVAGIVRPKEVNFLFCMCCACDRAKWSYCVCVVDKQGWEGYRRIIYRHFGAFGPIANIRILQKIGYVIVITDTHKHTHTHTRHSCTHTHAARSRSCS